MEQNWPLEEQISKIPEPFLKARTDESQEAVRALESLIISPDSKHYVEGMRGVERFLDSVKTNNREFYAALNKAVMQGFTRQETNECQTRAQRYSKIYRAGKENCLASADVLANAACEMREQDARCGYDETSIQKRYDQIEADIKHVQDNGCVEGDTLNRCAAGLILLHYVVDDYNKKKILSAYNPLVLAHRYTGQSSLRASICAFNNIEFRKKYTNREGPFRSAPHFMCEGIPDQEAAYFLSTLKDDSETIYEYLCQEIRWRNIELVQSFEGLHRPDYISRRVYHNAITAIRWAKEGDVESGRRLLIKLFEYIQRKPYDDDRSILNWNFGQVLANEKYQHDAYNVTFRALEILMKNRLGGGGVFKTQEYLLVGEMARLDAHTIEHMLQKPWKYYESMALQNVTNPSFISRVIMPWMLPTFIRRAKETKEETGVSVSKGWYAVGIGATVAGIAAAFLPGHANDILAGITALSALYEGSRFSAHKIEELKNKRKKNLDQSEQGLVPVSSTE